jgi:hypothetical protein
MRTAICFTVFWLAAASGAFAQQRPAVDAMSTKRDVIPSCIDFTNLGTVNPKLKNSCPDSQTIGVSNYRGGVHILDRVFHLKHGEERSITFPGDYMAITWVKDWTSDGNDDGSGYLVLTHRDVGGGYILWEVRNASADRFNAFTYTVLINGKIAGHAMDVIGPGQSSRLYAFAPDEKGYLSLEWSRLDPL